MEHLLLQIPFFEKKGTFPACAWCEGGFLRDRYIPCCFNLCHAAALYICVRFHTPYDSCVLLAAIEAVKASQRFSSAVPAGFPKADCIYDPHFRLTQHTPCFCAYFIRDCRCAMSVLSCTDMLHQRNNTLSSGTSSKRRRRAALAMLSGPAQKRELPCLTSGARRCIIMLSVPLWWNWQTQRT